jgi:hypothetical protein
MCEITWIFRAGMQLEGKNPETRSQISLSRLPKFVVPTTHIDTFHGWDAREDDSSLQVSCKLWWTAMDERKVRKPSAMRHLPSLCYSPYLVSNPSLGMLVTFDLWEKKEKNSRPNPQAPHEEQFRLEACVRFLSCSFHIPIVTRADAHYCVYPKDVSDWIPSVVVLNSHC